MKKISIPLDKQVVSREVAPKVTEALKKAGIEVEANYYWQRYTDRNGWRDWLLCRNNKKDKKYIYEDCIQEIPTYTTDEMLAVLPKYIEDDNRIRYSWHLNQHDIRYSNSDYKLNQSELLNLAVCYIDDISNPVTALANMVIWCAKNGYLSCTDGTQAG